jgi:hypothetical protein
MQSKIIEDDLMKVKSKLQEDFVNQIYKSCDPTDKNNLGGKSQLNKQNGTQKQVKKTLNTQ